MTKAICISCGTAKGAPWRTCPRCGLDPTRDDELLVRSVYLSTSRYTGDECEEALAYSKKLDDLGRMLSSGGKIEYDESEIARLWSQLKLIRSIPRSAVWGALLRFLLPGLVFVGGLWVLYFVLRYFLR